MKTTTIKINLLNSPGDFAREYWTKEDWEKHAQESQGKEPKYEEHTVTIVDNKAFDDMVANVKTRESYRYAVLDLSKVQGSNKIIKETIKYQHLIDRDMNKAKTTPSNIRAYILGNFRYWAFYSKNFKWLIRTHILEQIEFRIRVMEQECYDEGSCKMCGCTTTALQMANKSCDKPCYPPMFSARKWIKFAGGATIKGWKARTETKEVASKVIEKIYYIYKNDKLVHSKLIKL